VTRRRLAYLSLLVLLGLAFLLVIQINRREGAAPELAPNAWERLKERWVRRATVIRPQPAEAAEAAEAPSPPPLRPELAPEGKRPDRPPADPSLLARQAEEYAADRAKTVIELQPFRQSMSIDINGEDGRQGSATLINVNPAINAWYLLRLSWEDGEVSTFHLSNGRPEKQDLELDPEFPFGVMVVDTLGRKPCALWSKSAARNILETESSPSPYVSLCGEQVTLRMKTAGQRTTKEWATDFLRDYVWGGEQITVFVRETFFQDAYLNTSEVITDSETDTSFPESQSVSDRPSPAWLDLDHAEAMITPTELGISLDEHTTGGPMRVGVWYRVRRNPGIFLSAIQADLVAPEILRGHTEVVNPLDEVERTALVYLVAFDLAAFDLGFALGTDHPRVGWSERVPEAIRNPSLAGPDGIEDIAPLVPTGIISPSVADRAAATFTGGFKRAHGAFRSSELAQKNYGSHYGFIENGAVLSTLQPGLATLLVLHDGRVEMKTWTEADDTLLGRIKFARQNGVPIVETDPETGASIPGALVGRWALGNWSGSQNQRFRTLRAGACLQETETRRFLVYGYFSSATPSAMARVFQSYGCRYAMLLDMNALEHTYLAVYDVQGANLTVQHLIEGMSVLDKTVDGQLLPRFLGFADNRDFFYLLRREPSAAAAENGSTQGKR